MSNEAAPLDAELVAGNGRPGDPVKFSPGQRRALAALLTERTIAGAAEKAGVGERSIRRWLREEEAFREAYDAGVDESVDEALAVLKGAAVAAVRKLIELSTEAEKEAVQLAAAKAIVDRATDRSIEDLEQRVKALEARGVKP